MHKNNLRIQSSDPHITAQETNMVTYIAPNAIITFLSYIPAYLGSVSQSTIHPSSANTQHDNQALMHACE